MKSCPRCDAEIGNTAIACACGWHDRKAQKSSQVFEKKIPCAHDTCARLAVCRILTPTGWAALCDEHYSSHFLENAKKKCDSLSLNTVSQKRKWVAHNLKKLYANIAADLPLREPGQDEDYTYVQA